MSKIVLTEDAAKSFGRGRLTLTKDGETVVASFRPMGKPPSAKSEPVTISPGEITTIFVERP